MRPAAIRRTSTSTSTSTCASRPRAPLALTLLASLGLHAAACGGPSSPPPPATDAEAGGAGGARGGAGGAGGGAGVRGGSGGPGPGGGAQTAGASGAGGATSGGDAAPASPGGRDGGPVDPGPPPAGAPSLKRGINVGNVLDAPKEGAWGLKLEAEYFKLAKEAGFDHVRLPVRFSAHAAAAPPYTIAQAIFARVDFAIDQALANGLSIVVDVHHYDEIYDDPAGQRPRFVEMWRQIAARYKGRPPQVVFELLNEPRKMLTTEVWNPIAAETIAAIRAVDPTRDLIVEAGEYADAKELRDGLVLPAGDPHLIGSFHLYAPMLFTHQGTDNAGGEYATVGVLFPGPPATPIAPTAAALEKKWVADWFTKYNAEPVATNPSSEPVVADPVRKAFTWAEKTKLRVYVGEFGVNEAADEASRVRWLTFARKEMERRGFGWAVWNMFGGFGLYDPKTKAWNQKLKAALLP